MGSEVEEIARKLTDRQREALIACVDALSHQAGEGFCIAEDAIFDLFQAFNGPETDAGATYEEWVRNHLIGSATHG